MKITLLFSGLCLLVSCRQPATENHEKEAFDENVIVYEEYQGVAPEMPEATEIYTPVPPKVLPFSQNGAPEDAIVLFDGTNLDGWISSGDSTAANWYLNKNGTMTVKDRAGDIETKQHFGSIQLHLEWKSPEEVRREGQNRANSGVFLSGLYEVQILDNNDNDTYVNGQVGAFYKQHVPLAMASVSSGDWNSYDIIYRAPEFNEKGQKIKSGTMTVLHNGILIQDHVEIKGTTEYIGWPKNPAHGKGPVKLQDHGDDSRVSYRNIWLREL
jgi:hypothetical protein